MSAEDQKGIAESAQAILMALPPDDEEEFIGLLDKIAHGIRREPGTTKDTLADFVAMATRSES